MTREIKLGSYVQVIQDNDSGLLINRKGVVTSLANDHIWVKFRNHGIALPFNSNEVKRTNRTKQKDI